MNTPASGPRNSGRRPSWASILVNAGFLVAVALVMAIGVASLGLDPLLE